MLRPDMAKKDTTGFFIRPERQLINRLSQLSEEFKKGSANQVAVEIIREYLDFWVEAERAKREVLQRQQARFDAMRNEMLRQPLVKGATEQGKQLVTKKGKK